MTVGSLIAATTTGPGSVSDLGVGRRRFRMIWSSTGTPSMVVVNLEGSTDNSTWVVLATSTWPGQSAAPAPFAATSPGDDIRHLGGEVRYLRANLITLAGGSSPSISAVVMPIGGDVNP
jgi:hypothetical protein